MLEERWREVFGEANGGPESESEWIEEWRQRMLEERWREVFGEE
jgi:hypothetical protein